MKRGYKIKKRGCLPFKSPPGPANEHMLFSRILAEIVPYLNVRMAVAALIGQNTEDWVFRPQELYQSLLLPFCSDQPLDVQTIITLQP